MNIRLSDENGKECRWECWRDTRRPAGWMLRDHTGYVRVLASNWEQSVPHIRQIAGNHAMTLLQEVS